MISRESFVTLINAVQEQMKRESDLAVSLMNYFDGFIVPEISVKLQSTVLKVLADETGDKFETIEWWLFDAPGAGRNKDSAWIIVEGEIYRLDTVDKLYNFLVNVE